MDSEPGPQTSRQRELGNRLDAVRVRLEVLGERRPAADTGGADVRRQLEAARRHAAEARASAAHVLASGVEAFRKAADAHERAASMHEKAAAAGTGDVHAHLQQAALQRAAAAEDWQRAERAKAILSKPG